MSIAKTPELDYITVKGFKSIATMDKLTLGPINLIIGPNGSGKSNFIGVFSFLHEIREGRLNDYVRKAGGAEQLLHFGSRVTEKIEFFISFSKEVNQYALMLKPTTEDNLYPFEETAFYWDKKKHKEPFKQYLSAIDGGKEAGISYPGGSVRRPADWVWQRLGRWRLYHVHDTSAASPMRKTAKVEDNEFLRADGSNLA